MATTNPIEGELIPLYGLRFTASDLIVWVSSTGCTSTKDFQVRMSEGVPGQTAQELEIRRIHPDLCLAVERAVELVFPWKELDLGGGMKRFPIKVANRFGVLRSVF